jgi:hypothetical protein
MKTIITLSKRNILGLWIIFSLLFIYWLALLSTSDIEVRYLIPSLLLLAIFIFALPVIGTFCLYITIDERTLTVPMGLLFRQSISIGSIRALRFRPHAIGLMSSIIIEYIDLAGKTRTARLPSFTTFGRRKTAGMIRILLHYNPSIKLDPTITQRL